jgi:hypothetical protein
MDSNTHSIRPSEPSELSEPPEPPEPPERPDRLAALTAAVEELAAHDLDRLSDVALAEQVLELRRLLDRLEGRWLHQLAAIDARGAAGADQDQQPGSTAAWLRNRLRMGAGAATGSVRTARALFRGPLPQTAQALTSGVISPAHARVIAQGIHDLPDHLAAEADPVLVEAAGRLDPPRLRLAVGHLRQVADPDGADRDREHRHQRGGCGWPPPGKAWSRSTGCWNPRPATLCWPPWNRWPGRPTPRTRVPVASAPPTPWPSWPSAAWKQAGYPKRVGSGPSWR